MIKVTRKATNAIFWGLILYLSVIMIWDLSYFSIFFPEGKKSDFIRSISDTLYKSQFL